MGKPVGQRAHRALQRVDLAARPKQQLRPFREPLGELLGLGPIRCLLGHVHRGLAQPGHQPGRCPPGQQGRLDPQNGRNTQQYATPDSAPVVFDQVEVGGRDPGAFGQFRLPDTRGDASFANAGTGDRAFRDVIFYHESRPLAVRLIISLHFTRFESAFLYKIIVILKVLVE